MSVDCGRRAEIRQVVRSESVQASAVFKGTQFESDTIRHLEPVQLSSHEVLLLHAAAAAELKNRNW